MVYNASSVGTGHRTEGNLIWYDGYGNELGRWTATSGSNNPIYPTIPVGYYTAADYRNLIDPLYMRGNMTDGFRVHIYPDPMPDNVIGRDRTGMYIHPARYNGTMGCIGLTGTESDIYDFEDRIVNYLNTNHTIPLTVIF